MKIAIEYFWYAWVHDSSQT